MSESEYRSAREGAHARVAMLEDRLREHDASATAERDTPTSPFAVEKKELRARLTTINKGKGVGRLLLALAFMSIARATLFHGSSPAMGLIAIVITAAIVLTLLFRKSKPRGEELKLEQRLRKIIEAEDQQYARFRVETADTRKRVATEIEERARIEAELDEARELAKSVR